MPDAVDVNSAYNIHCFSWVAFSFLAISLFAYMKSETNCWWEKVNYLDRNVEFLLWLPGSPLVLRIHRLQKC